MTAEDKTPPELTVKTIKTTVGKDIDYKKAIKAVDAVDGDLTDAVQVSDIYVNHKQVGSYTAIYTVTDQAGNPGGGAGAGHRQPGEGEQNPAQQQGIVLKRQPVRHPHPHRHPQDLGGYGDLDVQRPQRGHRLRRAGDLGGAGEVYHHRQGGQAEGDLAPVSAAASPPPPSGWIAPA